MTDPIAPLPPEHVVELLSADLDGEFDAAARDLGYTPEGARAALASDPAAAEQRASLAQARADLAVTTLDDDVKTRLVAHALQAAPGDEVTARWRLRFNPRLVGSVAAAVLVVAGIAAALAVDPAGDDDAGTVASDAPADATQELDGDGAGGDGDDSGSVRQYATAIPDFGDVSDPDSLRARLEFEQSAGALSRLAANGTAADEYVAGDDADEDAAAESAPAPTLADDSCVAIQVEALEATGGLVLRGPGTHDGEPVEVLVFATDDSLEALVVGGDCSVRERVTLPPQP